MMETKVKNSFKATCLSNRKFLGFLLILIIFVAVSSIYIFYLSPKDLPKMPPELNQNLKQAIMQEPATPTSPITARILPLNEAKKIIIKLTSLKLQFITGKIDQTLIEDINKSLAPFYKQTGLNQISQLSDKSIFMILDDFTKAKTDILRQQDFQPSQGGNKAEKSFVKVLYQLITSQIYVERLQITDNSNELEIKLDSIWQDLQNLAFSGALEKTYSIEHISSGFDSWINEYQAFYTQIEIIDFLIEDLSNR